MQHVLLIGGETAVCDVVQSALRGIGGYRVTRAASSEEALPLFDCDRPSLAIIDSVLPGMPGIDLAREARRLAVPVLFLSEDTEPEPPKPGFATLRKPVALKELLARSQALIAEAEMQHRVLHASLKTIRASRDALHAALKQVRETITGVRHDHGEAPNGRTQPYDFRSDPVLRGALAYWMTKRGMRAMPQRRDIDPSELPRHLLPQLQLIDVIEGGQRFFFRLVGTAIVEAFGGEFTGKYTEEVVAAERIEFLHTCYRMVVTARRPLFLRSTYLTCKPIEVTANRLLMPLSEDGKQVNMILGALTFDTVPDNGGVDQRFVDIPMAAIGIVR